MVSQMWGGCSGLSKLYLKSHGDQNVSDSQIMSDDFRPHKWPVLLAIQATQRRRGDCSSDGLSLHSMSHYLSLYCIWILPGVLDPILLVILKR